MASISLMRRAFNDLTASSVTLADSQLAYAILIALPASYSTIASTFYMLGDPTSADVISAVNDELRRRQTQENGALALAAKMAKLSGISNKKNIRNYQREQKERTPAIKDGSKPYCEFHDTNSHSSTDCRAAQRVKAAHLASAAPTTDMASSSKDSGINFIATVLPSAFLATGNARTMVVDSGASHTMVYDSELLSNIKSLPTPVSVVIGNGSTINATKTGTLTLCNGFKIPDTLLVPDLGRNLLSVRSTTSPTLSWTFNTGTAILSDGSHPVLTAKLQDHLYTLPCLSSTVHAHIVTPDTPEHLLESWHRRLGHLHVQAVATLGRSGRLGDAGSWAKVSSDGFVCTECIQGKGKRLPSPPSLQRATTLLGALHLDLFGPTRTTSHDGYRTFLTIYDDFSQHLQILFLKAKSDTLSTVQQYIQLVENQLGRRVKSLRSDRGGEFTSLAFKQYTSTKGIDHQLVPPAAHAQNGRVERAHLSLLDLVRTLLVDSGLPDKFWSDAARYAAYTRNRAPRANGSIPEDLWRNTKVPYGHMHPFGCQVYYRSHTEMDKLKPRYLPGRLLGYEVNTTNYRIWDTTNNRLVISRDVTFQGRPTVMHPASNPADLSHATNKTTSATHYIPGKVTTSMDTPLPESEQPDRGSPSPEPQWRGWVVEEDPRYHRSPAPTPGPLPGATVQDTDNQLRRSRRQAGEDPEVEPRSLEDRLALHADTTTGTDLSTLAFAAYSAILAPQSFADARQSPHWDQWQSAINDELSKMEKYKVWEVVDRHKATGRTLKARWVFTRKIDGTTGEPAGFKARWVAKGYSQRFGIDYNELYAGVAHKDSIRFFFAIVNYLGYHCDAVDIVAAFLNGDLDETIYLEPPEGSGIPANKVIHLLKSLYGLKQSPRCFNKKLDQWLRSQGFTPATADNCIYHRIRDGITIIIALHVDDQLVASSSQPELNRFKAQLHSAFEIKDNGPASYFLGVNIYRDRTSKRLLLSQEHYVKAVLDRFGMTTCTPSHTPLPSGYRAIEATDLEFEQVKDQPYPAMVGSLLYAATITRPDIAFATSLLARTASKWSAQHIAAARHLMRYLRGTTAFCLTYDASLSTAKPSIQGYADADWGGCLNTRRSTTGYLFYGFGGPISWRSKRQPTTALSTAEAEYMASSDAARQAIWLRHLAENFGYQHSNGIPILNDNQAAILLSKNPVQHDRSKHIDIRYHFIREKVEHGDITLNHVATEHNLADLFTKSLPADRHQKLSKAIGMHLKPLQEIHDEGECQNTRGSSDK
uniref:Gag-Pol-p199 n=1 Tax=Tremella fuciformis TaxID=64657 RepID=D5KY22_9TREE|nr:rve [Tremella fuciformis]